MTLDVNTIIIATSDREEMKGLIDYLTGEGHKTVGVQD